MSERSTQIRRVLHYIEHYPDKSATQIANALKLKKANVSALLVALTKLKRLARTAGGGPRGGYTYRLAFKPYRSKTAWERLTDDPPI